MDRRPAVVAYDIADDRTRRAALRILREWRLDGQLSVHECLLSAAEAAELFVQLAEVLDPDTDRLLLAWLHTRRPALARGKGRVAGVPEPLHHVR
jgi:CRISPR-associated protein Cas2